jgi:hypothetical protein
MTIKSMTGPETGSDVAGRDSGSRFGRRRSPSCIPVRFSSLRRFRRIICRKPDGYVNVSGKTLHRSAWLSQQSLEGPSICLGKRMMAFRKLARR